MPNPFSWTYLTAPPDQTPVWGPFSVAFLVLFGVGLVGSIALYNDVGGRLRRGRLLRETVRRATALLIPIFAVGLVFFLFRYLRLSAFHLSMRLWLYLALAAALGVTTYYVRQYRLATRPPGRGWLPFLPGRAQADANRWYGRLAAALFAFYMAIAIGLYVWRGVFFHPDRWAILLFVAALVLGQWKAFLRDWIPVVFLIFGYEFMRGLAWQFISERHRTIHLTELIAADRAMFGGHIPALWLQRQFYEPGTIHWYDLMAVVLYAMHFVFPLIFAFTLWIGSKERFWRFTLAFLVMTYAGFVIYLFYPAAPPWLANDWGHIHGLQVPFNQVWRALSPQPLNNLDQVQIWNYASGNPVAAMPSLHAAYPWITLLFAVKFYGKKGLLLVPYNLALWFAVLYLGQHWFIDVIGGVALATAAFVLMELAWPRIRALASQPPRARRRVRPARTAALTPQPPPPTVGGGGDDG